MDASGNILGLTSALPFGQLTNNRADDGFPFTDLVLDSGNDSCHALHRNHSPLQGHWLSPDPYIGNCSLTDPQTLNR
jgi:hypothetical protein